MIPHGSIIWSEEYAILEQVSLVTIITLVSLSIYLFLDIYLLSHSSIVYLSFYSYMFVDVF